MTTPRRIEHLVEADVLQAIAGVLLTPRGDGLARIAALGPVASQIGGLIGCVDTLQALAEAAQQASDLAIAEEHTRLHEGAVACPIHESSYVNRDKGHVIADIAAFYRAFGLDHAALVAEKLDHLGVELQFLALLLVMEHQAIELGLTAEAATTATALRSFVADHAGPFVPSFVVTLRAAAAHPFHLRLADVLEEFWSGFCARRGFAPGQPMAAEKPRGSTDEFECGALAASPACQPLAPDH